MLMPETPDDDRVDGTNFPGCCASLNCELSAGVTSARGMRAMDHVLP